MNKIWIVMLGAALACQQERNMDSDAAARDSGADISSAAAEGGNGGSAVAAAADDSVTVLFFGTSLTAGYGLDPVRAYPAVIARLAQEEGVPLVALNAGLSGETSAGALRRIEWVLRSPVDIVVLETGGNDALRALNADSLKANLEGIVRRIRNAQPEARILLVLMEAPPNLGSRYTAAFRQAYAEVAEREGVQLAPFLLDGVAGIASLNQADGVHPNARGAEIVADNVWRVLAPVVAEMRNR